MDNPLWQALLPHFDGRYATLLGLLDLGLAFRQPDCRLEPGQPAESLLKNLSLVRSIVESRIR